MDLEANWQKALLSIKATIEDAIRNLNESGLQIGLVVSEDEKLLGTITDGDIRRGLLRGIDLTSSVQNVFNLDALVVPFQANRDLVFHIMQVNKVRQLPVVDEHRRIVGLYRWDILSKRTDCSNLMIIMAGGFGSRLRPYTNTCPKPLLPVAGKPMLEHIIERAKTEGLDRFIIATHYLGEMIENHFGDGESWGVQIEYLREKNPLGTAGALSLLKALPTEPFIVTNADILTKLRYKELLDYHVQHGASATMVVRQHKWENPFGVVQTKGVDIIAFEEKPIVRNYVNAGVYVLEPQVLSYLKGEVNCDMPLLFERLQEAGLRTVVYPIHEAWLDVGRPDDFKKAQQHVVKNILEESVI